MEEMKSEPYEYGKIFADNAREILSMGETKPTPMKSPCPNGVTGGECHCREAMEEAHIKCECHQCTWLRSGQFERFFIPNDVNQSDALLKEVQDLRDKYTQAIADSEDSVPYDHVKGLVEALKLISVFEHNTDCDDEYGCDLSEKQIAIDALEEYRRATEGK